MGGFFNDTNNRKTNMSGETTVSQLLKNIRIGNAVVKYNQGIDEAAKFFEVTPDRVRKAIQDLNRNLKTLNTMWQRSKTNF